MTTRQSKGDSVKSSTNVPDLEAVLCVCVILSDPLTSIVEQHVQWQVLLFEVINKLLH